MYTVELYTCIAKLYVVWVVVYSCCSGLYSSLSLQYTSSTPPLRDTRDDPRVGRVGALLLCRCDPLDPLDPTV